MSLPVFYSLPLFGLLDNLFAFTLEPLCGSHKGSHTSEMGYTFLHRPQFPCLDHSRSDELPCFPKWSRLSKDNAPVWKHPDTLIDNIHAEKAKRKHWTSAKVHWRDDSEVEGEQAVNSVGAPFQVMSRSFCCHYTASAFRERSGKSNAPLHSTPLHSTSAIARRMPVCCCSREIV